MSRSSFVRRLALIASVASAAALISGGARGIGRAVAESLLGDGWRVAVCNRAHEADARSLEAWAQARVQVARAPERAARPRSGPVCGRPCRSQGR